MLTNIIESINYARLPSIVSKGHHRGTGMAAIPKKKKKNE